MKNNRKGFTMAELLIVVAIIAVLVAVAIPVFNTQLEKSRDAVTISNLRNAYAEATAKYLGGEHDDSNENTVTIENVEFKGTQPGFEDVAAVDALPFGWKTTEGDAKIWYHVDLGENGKGEKSTLGMITNSKRTVTFDFSSSESGGAVIVTEINES